MFCTSVDSWHHLKTLSLMLQISSKIFKKKCSEAWSCFRICLQYGSGSRLVQHPHELQGIHIYIYIYIITFVYVALLYLTLYSQLFTWLSPTQFLIRASFTPAQRKMFAANLSNKQIDDAKIQHEWNTQYCLVLPVVSSEIFCFVTIRLKNNTTA